MLFSTRSFQFDFTQNYNYTNFYFPILLFFFFFYKMFASLASIKYMTNWQEFRHYVSYVPVKKFDSMSISEQFQNTAVIYVQRFDQFRLKW